MKLKLYSVLDTKAACFLPPFFARADGEAVRAFESSIMRADQSSLATHPCDFVLYRIGEFSDETAELVAEQRLVSIVRGEAVANAMVHSPDMFADLTDECVGGEMRENKADG